MMKRAVAFILLLMLVCPLAMGEGERVIDPQKPMVALTFDDGPSEYTMELLSILEEYDCRATFFVMGKKIKGKEDALLKMAEDGHSIGNHSWSHPDLSQKEKSKIYNELKRCNDKIYEVTGMTPRFLRPPYGNVSDVMYAEAKSLRMIAVTWSLDTEDWSSHDTDQICRKVIQELNDGDIILFHDTVAESIEAVRRLIPELMQQGYQLVTIDEMLDCSAKQLTYKRRYFEMLPEQRKTGNIQN